MKIKILIITCFILFLSISSFSELEQSEINKRLLKAVKQIKEKKYKRAILILKKVLKQTPDNKKVKYLLAKCYSFIHNYDKAVSIYGRILSTNPEDLYVLNELGSVCLRMYKINKSIYFYKQVEKKVPNSPYPVIGLIQAYLIQGKIVKVKEYLDKLEELSSTFPKAKEISNMFKIKVLLAQNLTMEAYDYIESQLEQSQGNTGYMIEKINILMDMGNIVEAQKIADIVMKKQMRMGYMYSTIFKLALRYKKFGLAKKYINDYKKKFDDEHVYYFFLGKVAVAEQKYELAQRCFLKSIARNNYYINTYYSLINLYIKTKKFQLASQWLEQYLQYFKEIKGAEYLKVKLLTKMGKRKQGLDLIKKIIKRNKDNVNILMNASYFLWNELKDYKYALKIMKNAIKLYPENIRLLNNLSYFYATSAKAKYRNSFLSLKYAKIAVNKTRSLNAVYLDTLAAAYFANGQRSKALTIQKRVLKMNPIDEEFRKNYNRYVGN